MVLIKAHCTVSDGLIQDSHLSVLSWSHDDRSFPGGEDLDLAMTAECIA